MDVERDSSTRMLTRNRCPSAVTSKGFRWKNDGFEASSKSRCGIPTSSVWNLRNLRSQRRTEQNAMGRKVRKVDVAAVGSAPGWDMAEGLADHGGVGHPTAGSISVRRL